MDYLNHNKKIIFHFIMIPIIVATTIASENKNYNNYNYESEEEYASKFSTCIIITFVFFIIIAVLI